MHNIDMPIDLIKIGALYLQQPPGFDTAYRWWRRFRDRGMTNLMVPIFNATPYGQLSEGLFWEAQRSRRAHMRLARLWRVFHYGIGVLGVVLAGLAGFGGLSKLLGDEQVALIAIGSGIATGLITFLKSDEKRRQHEELAAAWDNLGDDVTTLYITRPRSDDTQQGEADSKESDPDGWQAVIDALMKRAKSIREGKPTLEPSAAWPTMKTRTRQQRTAPRSATTARESAERGVQEPPA